MLNLSVLNLSEDRLRLADLMTSRYEINDALGVTENEKKQFLITGSQFTLFVQEVHLLIDFGGEARHEGFNKGA